MPPGAVEKGKAPKKRGAKRGAEDDSLSLADLLARCTRADLEALLLAHEDDLPGLRDEVEARLAPEQVRPVACEGPTLRGCREARARDRRAAASRDARVRP